MRRAFTLIEMMISVVIFSIVVVFLYRAYGSLQHSNQKYETLQQKLDKEFKLKKLLYLDFSLLVDGNVTVLHQDTSSDVVFLQTSHSIHDRINPYVAYIFKEGMLYRMESLYPFREYPLGVDRVGDVDVLVHAKRFRLYGALKKDGNNINRLYLLDLLQTDGEHIVYKIRALNQF